MSVYKLPNSLTIHNVKEVQDSLLVYLEQSNLEGAKVIIDASDLNDIDASGVQLLVSACKTLDEEKREYTVENINEDLENMLRVSGVLDTITS